MDMQRTTYCEAAMAIMEEYSLPKLARVVDCAIGLWDFENDACRSFDWLMDYVQNPTNLPLHADRHAGAGADPILSLGAHNITGAAELQNGIDLTCAVAGGSDLFSSGTPGGTAYCRFFNQDYGALVGAGGVLYGYDGDLDIGITDDVAHYLVGNQQTVHKNVAATKTDTGYMAGLITDVLRNSISGVDDDGTLAGLYGWILQYGHYNREAAESPQTTKAYGLYITPFKRTGTIGTAYDIYLAAEVAGGTVTNPWGIYQANTKPNHFAGKVNFAGGVSVGGVDGYSGNWVNAAGDTVTVVNGIITDVS